MAAPKGTAHRNTDDGKPQKPSDYRGATPIPLRRKHRAPR